MGFEQDAQQIELTVRGMTCDACALHVARALQGVTGEPHGDASLFTRGDRAELAWRLLDPILAAWQAGEAPLSIYEPDSWGPAEADELLARDGRSWLHGCAHEED